MGIRLLFLLVCLPLKAYDFAGGTGKPHDPYQIATAQQLMSLGSDPNLLDKHFILISDIDLDPNLAGGRVFDRAVIAPDVDEVVYGFQGTAFTGSMDGQGHTISNLLVDSNSEYAGLYGLIDTQGRINQLHLSDACVRGKAHHVRARGSARCGTGALAGENRGFIEDCHGTAMVSGVDNVGGLVGENQGLIQGCTFAGSVNGDEDVGGLVGFNYARSMVLWCSSQGAVTGTDRFIGGLVGENDGTIMHSQSAGQVKGGNCVGGLAGLSDNFIFNCYSTGIIDGNDIIGGLVGENRSRIVNSCSQAKVTGRHSVGGLVGESSDFISHCMSKGSVNGSNWVGGFIGRNAGTIANSFSASAVHGPHAHVSGFSRGTILNSFWEMEAAGYYHHRPSDGLTTAEMQDPNTYLDAGWDLLGEQDNGTSEIWHIPPGGAYPELSVFAGHVPPTLSGNGSAHEPYLIESPSDLGAMYYQPTASYSLVADLDLHGIRWSTAVMPAFRGYFAGQGHVIRNLSIAGHGDIGLFGALLPGSLVSGLGLENVSIARAGGYAGGLASESAGTIFSCYTTGSIAGNEATIGGLLGHNSGMVVNSYSSCSVAGDPVNRSRYMGGLIGFNSGSVENCYARGPVSDDAESGDGGLIGRGRGPVSNSVWDTETSGLPRGDGGTGLTSLQLQDQGTYLDMGWDFLGETENGLSEIWTIPSGGTYPVLSVFYGQVPTLPAGEGQVGNPYVLVKPADIGTLYHRPTACYQQAANIDLSGVAWSTAVAPFFAGSLDGNGHVIRNLTVSGGANLGLFGLLQKQAKVLSLGLEDVNVVGADDFIGGLAGYSEGLISNSYCTGNISGTGHDVGGLVGNNAGVIFGCYLAGSVKGTGNVGGLTGENSHMVSNSYSIGSVHGHSHVGGLVGFCAFGRVVSCYSTSTTSAVESFGGGLVGWNRGTVIDSFGDIGASGLSGSDGGVGLTTDEAMDPYMLGLAGLGGNPHWLVDAHRDYPKLVWQDSNGQPIRRPDVDWPEGRGTAEHPYNIDSPSQLLFLGKASALWDKHFVLTADLDLDPNLPGNQCFGQAVIPEFAGSFDGNRHVISNLCIRGTNHLGLFGRLDKEASIKSLGLTQVDINGIGYYVGGLVGYNTRGIISDSYCQGIVKGRIGAGGLAGTSHHGTVRNCYSKGKVGGTYVGGLVGRNVNGIITDSYSRCTINYLPYYGGAGYTGGLVGYNSGSISNCYSTGAATGPKVRGLVGDEYSPRARVSNSFWDIESSGLTFSYGGTGLSTAELQSADTFLNAGWDFTNETANGSEDLWWISEDRDYPRLHWETN